MTEMRQRLIYCCQCEKDVEAELVSGEDTYPHRPDLARLPFWRCRNCGSFVGCYYKTKDRTRPLGVIPTAEMKVIRQRIHRVIDPVWQEGKTPRGKIYERMSQLLGKEFHTAELRSLNDCEKALEAAYVIQKENHHD